MMRPKSIEVGLDLKLFSIKGTWEPNEAERRAAWELYVELVTRVTVVPLTNGIARESLSSMYAVFDQAREILRRYGPVVAEPKPNDGYTFGYLTIAILNYSIRPLLSYWHPELQAWEATRPGGRSVKTHEDEWARIDELRSAIEETRLMTSRYAELLARACNIPSLDTGVPL